MKSTNRIEELETLLAEARQVGLSAISRADKWCAALTTISLRSRDLAMREFASNALTDI